MPSDKTGPGTQIVPAANPLSATHAGAFCPHGGLMPDSTAQFSEDMRCLLGQRLRIAAIILFVGSLTFLVHNLLSPHDQAWESHVLAPHILLTLVLGGLSALLVAKSCPSMRVLRIYESAMFGLPAAFFIWVQFCTVHYTTPDKIVAAASAFPAETTVRWMVLMSMYGVFIPNTCRRAATVVGAMVVVLMVAVFGAMAQEPHVRDVLMQPGGLSKMIIWVGIAGVTAVYGSHRFGTLRR